MRVVLIGGGGHGSVVAEIVEKTPDLDLIGILDSQIAAGTNVFGYEVLGPVEVLRELIVSRGVAGAVVAVGDNWTRGQIIAALRDLAPSLAYPNVVHPSAQIGKHVRLGAGTVVMAGAVVNTNSTIGEFCILNTNCSLDHDSVLGDFASLAPNSCAGGGTRIGAYSAICLGANIIDRVEIGEHTVIGAGATVLHNQPAQIVAYGTPARKIQDRRIGQRYLKSP